MRLGKASAYGVYATLHIAQNDDKGPIQGRDVAKSCGIPVEYLLKILQQLVRAQVLTSERGRGGGFMLRKAAAQTTVLEIMEAIEGPIGHDLNVRRGVGVKDRTRSRIEGICKDIADNTKSRLTKATIKSLLG
jgi:Rrf2 family protein